MLKLAASISRMAATVIHTRLCMLDHMIGTRKSIAAKITAGN